MLSHGIHVSTQMLSTSTRITLDLLEVDFTHFEYHHMLITYNALTFLYEEFQSQCKEWEHMQLTGAPYHPATSGTTEGLVQTFKQALRKSYLPEASSYTILNAVPEKADILWILSMRTLDVPDWDLFSAAIARTHSSGQAIQDVIKGGNDTKLGRCH